MPEPPLALKGPIAKNISEQAAVPHRRHRVPSRSAVCPLNLGSAGSDSTSARPSGFSRCRVQFLSPGRYCQRGARGRQKRASTRRPRCSQCPPSDHAWVPTTSRPCIAGPQARSARHEPRRSTGAFVKASAEAPCAGHQLRNPPALLITWKPRSRGSGKVLRRGAAYSLRPLFTSSPCLFWGSPREQRATARPGGAAGGRPSVRTAICQQTSRQRRRRPTKGRTRHVGVEDRALHAPRPAARGPTTRSRSASR